MKLENLAIIINYCSLHKQFIDANIEQCLKVTNNVMLSIGSHLYDGRPESDKQLSQLSKKYPTVFILSFNTLNIDKEYPNEYSNKISTRSRILSYKKCIMKFDNIEWMLFLDSDEIPEGDKLKIFLSKSQFDNDKNYMFSNYWYFREPIYQSLTFEQNPLLIHINNIKDHILESQYERNGFINDINETKKTEKFVNDIDGNPMFHHFSWAYSKEKMIEKVKWSFSKDNHILLFQCIENEFESPFKMKDFIHNYDYKIVENIFNITDY